MRFLKAEISAQEVYKARTDPKIKEKIYLNDVKPLALSLIFKFDISEEDQDDLMQEMYLGYNRAVTGYDERKHSKFTSYLYRVFRNIISDYFSEQGEKRDFVKKIKEPEKEEPRGLIENIPYFGLTPENELIYKEYVKKLEDLLEVLPPFERQILTLMMEGYSIKEVAKELGVTQQKITALVRIPSGDIYKKVKTILAKYIKRLRTAQEPQPQEPQQENNMFEKDTSFPNEVTPQKEEDSEEELEKKSLKLILHDLKQIKNLYGLKTKKEFLNKLLEFGWGEDRLIEIFGDDFNKFFK